MQFLSLGLLLFLPSRCTPLHSAFEIPLPFLPVFGKNDLLRTVFCQRLIFGLFFFPGSKLHLTKCSTLAFLACLLSTLLLLFFVHLYLFFSLCFCPVPYFLARVLEVLVCSCEIFFLIAVTSFKKINDWSSVVGFQPVHLYSFSERRLCVSLLVFSPNSENGPKVPKVFLRWGCRLRRFFSLAR